MFRILKDAAIQGFPLFFLGVSFGVPSSASWSADLMSKHLSLQLDRSVPRLVLFGI